MKTAASSPSVVPFCFNDHLFRAITIGNDPWFVVRDVCNALGLSNLGEAVRGLRDDELTSEFLMSGGQKREMKLVSESGLYRLIFRSNKQEAEAFRQWVFCEVLPSIRKTGSYQTPAGDRRVFVNHAHSKSTTAPNGLDIRYTLDLGKIVANPTRRGVELLERLTGIQLSDIPISEEEGERAVEVVKGFLADRCRFSPGAHVLFATVYAAYRQHCGDIGEVLPGQVVSRKRLSILMSAAGYSSQKIGGVVRMIDTALVDGGEVRS